MKPFTAPASTLALPLLLAPSTASAQDPPEVVNLGLEAEAISAGLLFSAAEGYFAFQVAEVEQGDVNGDGDTADRFIFLHDPGDATVYDPAYPPGLRRLPHAAGHERPVIQLGKVFYFVDEEDDGVDHTGDGQLDDTVLATYTIASGSVVLSSKVAGSQNDYTHMDPKGGMVLVVQQGTCEEPVPCPSCDDLVVLDQVAGTSTLLLPSPVLTVTFESFGAGTQRVAILDTDCDLGVGSAGHLMAGVFDTATGALVDHAPLALEKHFSLAAAGTYLYLMGDEADAQQDFNEDGDTSDVVPHVYDTATGTLFNTKLDSYSYTSVGSYSDHAFAFVADEAAKGADLNGDGDTSDYVLHVWSALNGLESTDLATAWTSDNVPYTVLGTKVAFQVSEADQTAAGDPQPPTGPGGGLAGTDYNGDGDDADLVLLVYDAAAPAGQRLTNLGLATISRAPALSDTHLAFLVDDSPTGEGAELSDEPSGVGVEGVVFVHEFATGETVNTGLRARAFAAEDLSTPEPVHWSLELGDEVLALLGAESGPLPWQFGIYDLEDKVSFQTGLRGSPLQARKPVLNGRNVLAMIREEGSDLNGDGDGTDLHVAHLGTLPQDSCGRLALFGSGCGATDAYKAPDLVGRGCARLGNTVHLNVFRGGDFGELALLYYGTGFAEIAVPGFGADCVAYLLVPNLLSQQAISNDGAAVTWPIPLLDPALVGVPFYFQGAVTRPDTPANIALTNGLELVTAP
ncbi:MAG: hypothetical protein AAF682_16915 [Planctomycetota bacterium]